MQNTIYNLKVFVNYLVAAFLLAMALGLAISPSAAAVSEASKSAVCEGIAATADEGSCDSDSADGEINSTIEAAINILSIVAGIIAVIMIIVSGIKYILASGDPNNINSAKNTLLYAIVGLVVVVFAQIIVRFVLSKAS